MKALVIAASLAIGLAGCAPMRSAPKVVSATTPRIVNVYVVSGPQQAGSSCPTRRVLVVDQEPIYVFLGNAPDQPPVPMRWQMNTPGFTFKSTRDPAPVQGSGAQAGHVHTCRPVGAGQTEFQCMNNARSAGAWKYTLSVDKPAGDNCPGPDDLDPTVVNG